MQRVFRKLTSLWALIALAVSVVLPRPCLCASPAEAGLDESSALPSCCSAAAMPRGCCGSANSDDNVFPYTPCKASDCGDDCDNCPGCAVDTLVAASIGNGGANLLAGTPYFPGSGGSADAPYALLVAPDFSHSASLAYDGRWLPSGAGTVPPGGDLLAFHCIRRN